MSRLHCIGADADMTADEALASNSDHVVVPHYTAIKFGAPGVNPRILRCAVAVTVTHETSATLHPRGPGLAA